MYRQRHQGNHEQCHRTDEIPEGTVRDTLICRPLHRPAKTKLLPRNDPVVFCDRLKKAMEGEEGGMWAMPAD